MSKLVNCKACQKEIAKGVNKCPSCGKDQRNFIGQHKILAGIVIVIVLGTIGSKMGNTPTKVATSDTSTKTASTTPVETTKSTVFKVGDTVKLSNYKVKVNKTLIVEGNDFTKPKEGNEFFAVDCTIENTSSTEQTISSIIMFKIVDKDGRACAQSIMTQGSGQLDGVIGAGRKMTEQYVVEAPKGATELELEFDGSLFTSGQIVVKLN